MSHIDGYIKNFQEIPVSLVPVLDTALYATGDVMFVPTLFTVQSQVGLGGNKKLRIRIRDITILDGDLEQPVFDLVFLSANAPSFGVLNAACAISDADMAAQFRRFVSVTSYTVLAAGLNSIAQPQFDPFTIQCPAGALGFYLAAISRGAPTFTTTADLKIIVGCEILNDVRA